MREHYLARRDLITTSRVVRAVVVIGFPWKRGVVEIAGAAGKPQPAPALSELRAVRRGLAASGHACRLRRRGAGVPSGRNKRR